MRVDKFTDEYGFLVSSHLARKAAGKNQSSSPSPARLILPRSELIAAAKIAAMMSPITPIGILLMTNVGKT